MKVIWGLERSNQNNRLLQDGIGKIRYHIWFWLLIISFLMLFYKGCYLYHTYAVQEQETQSNQKDHVTMSQVSNRRTAASPGLLYKSENELIECKGYADKPVFLGVLFLLMVYLGVYLGNYKVQWLDYVFFSEYLQKLIQYMYLSDGKKRRYAFS